jgi:hypothetical protein
MFPVSLTITQFFPANLTGLTGVVDNPILHGRQNKNSLKSAVLFCGSKLYIKETLLSYNFTTFAACGPLLPWTISNSTFCPSSSVLKPSDWIEEK